MKISLKGLTTAIAVAVGAVALLAPIASAGTPTTGASANTMMAGMGTWSGTGMWGMGSGMIWLTDNPVAMQAWLQLRTEHLADMQTWYDTYKANLTTPEAQQALHDLWTAHMNDMQSFFAQYASGADWTPPAMGMWSGWQMGDMMGGTSWNASHMWGSGYGASWMTSNPAGMGQWLAMRGRQMSATNAWMQQYSAAPAGPAAQAAAKTLMAHQRAQVRHFYKLHHLPTSSAMMRAGTGGWMGLGGMWGGFGW
jgi:hypothetical protein